MFLSRLGFDLDRFRLFNMDGGGGMGGDGGDPGFDPGSGGGDPSDAPAEPAVIDIPDDNALIRVKGIDKPVKYGEHVRGFQKEFTRASQRAAELQRQLEERDRKLQDYERSRQQAQSQPQGRQQGQNDLLSQIAELPYLSGQDAALVVQNIAGQIQQRDQVLLGTLRKMQQMEQIINGLSGAHSSAQFEQKIGKFLQDGGYDPQVYGDFARELYVAYEGDDLDNEFPNILASRIDQLRKAFVAENQRKIEAARKQPFIPGRGGMANPSKALEIKPNARASEIADLLFPAIQQGSGT